MDNRVLRRQLQRRLRQHRQRRRNINWYNFTYTQYHNSYGPLAIYPGPYWDDVHNVYSHRGTIGSWLDAADVMQNGVVCTNYYNQPFDFVYGV